MTVDVRVVGSDDEWAAFTRVFGQAMGRPLPDELSPYWRAVLDADRTFGGFVDGRMVATAADFTTDLTLPGGATVPVAAVTGVGTLPTHRRRGAADTLMRHQLATARERGAAAAILYASETTIYERWGYGAAAPRSRHTLDLAHARLRRAPDTGGSVVPLGEDEQRDVLVPIHDRTRLRTPGEIRRPDAGWDIRMYEGADGKSTPKTYVAHLDASGTADGFLVYTFDGTWEHGVPAGKLEVVDVAALTPGAYLALWAWVLEMDLATRLETSMLADDDPLLFALADPRQLRVLNRGEGLWVRPLDVARLLSTRDWLCDGELVLEVTDPLFADEAGGYRVARSGGEVTVERTGDEPDLTLGASELGSVLLGSVPVVPLALAGRVTARSEESLATAARMFPAARAAICRTGF